MGLKIIIRQNDQMASPTKSDRNPVLDIVKGIAIIFVATGHNRYFSQINISIYHFFYNFHVWAFFLLVTAYAVPPLTWGKAKDTVTRSIVPNTCSIIAVSLLYFCVFLRHSTSILDFIPTVAVALIFQTAPLLSQSTGFQFYWFLPAFCTFSLIWAGLSTLRAKRKTIVYASLALLHGFIALIPENIVPWIPFGLAPALYIPPLALVTKPLVSLLLNRPPIIMTVAIPVFTIGSFLSLNRQNYVNLGYNYLYGFNHPELMLLHDAIAMSGFLILFKLAVVIKNNGLLERLGKNSLIIFLTHLIFFQTLWQLLPSTHTQTTNPLLLLVYGTVSLFLCMAAGLIFAALMRQAPLLRNMAFPHSYQEWRQAITWGVTSR